MTAMNLLKSMDYLDEELIAAAMDTSNLKSGKRLSPTVLIAAVLLAGILLISACAAMGGAVHFLQYFSDAAPGKLSAEQVEYIAANTVDVNKSQTVNGYTLTLNSVFSDGRDILLQFELTAPSGTVLDAESYSDLHGTVIESEAGLPMGMAMHWQLQDEDRTDNKVRLFYSIESAWNGKKPFTESHCKLYVYGLEAVRHDLMEPRSERLTEGCWTYDIHFPEDCVRSIAFVDAPVAVTATVTVGYEKTGENTMKAIEEQLYGEISSLNLWALGAELSFRFGEESRNADFGDIRVVMKTGEEIVLKQHFTMPDFLTYKTETPIILDQVACLQLEDGTVFHVP